MSSAGLTVWQLLPLGPTHSDLSPYGGYSAHAGNPELISLEKLQQKHWMRLIQDNKTASQQAVSKQLYLRQAYKWFIDFADEGELTSFRNFKSQNRYWLEDFALYVCLKQQFNQSSWIQWPPEFRHYNKDILQEYAIKNSHAIDQQKFIQYIFYSQWREIKQYANERNIIIMGDIPIFVAYDSADVWANKHYFSIDKNLQPTFVAGVPPDYFSQTGQRWGNPLYDWQAMQEDDFTWWIQRIQSQHELFDVIRIDHFRGLAQYWEIPGTEETAQNGRWVSAPGRKLLAEIMHNFPGICLAAEDLGTITDDVIQLRDGFNLPGMKVLQFAFDGSKDNPHLPANYTQNCIAYTGTHDNNTTIGWFDELPDDARNYIMGIINHCDLAMPWPMVHTVLSSQANTAILPMQDLLALDGSNRMNIPGIIDSNNWRWRFFWSQVEEQNILHIKSLIKMYDR